MPEVRTMLETPDGSSGRKRPLSSRRVRLIALIGTTVAATVAVFAAVVPSASAATLFSDDFQDGDVSGWSKSGGEWAVVTDGTLALRQSKLDSELAREFAGSTSWTNYSVQARVKPLAFDGASRYVGIAARASGSTTFYRLALLNTNRVELQAVNGGSVTVLGAVSRTVSTGTWYTLRIDVSGTHASPASSTAPRSGRPATAWRTPAASVCRPSTPPRPSTTSW